jgi:hypothetical protein
MSFLTGKPATQTSNNTNKALINSTYSPMMNAGVNSTNIMQSLLTGSGDTAGANADFHNYEDNAGYTNALQALQKGVIGGQAASGLLRSGSTGTALLTKGAGLDSSMYDNYLQHLQGLSGLGLQAGGLVTNAGQQSTGTSATPGLFGTLGSLAGGAMGILNAPATFGAGTIGSKVFSDRRLKTDIEKIGELEDGLGLYVYRYIDAAMRFVGVMADEVARLRPWALGPKVRGYATVNYEAL